jgi:hypothetical protein
MTGPLTSREAYDPLVARKIELLGTIAISIANRWQLGWPERVQALLKSNQYLTCLEAQMNLEKDIIAEASDLRHLAHHELLALHEVQEAPPLPN